MRLEKLLAPRSVAVWGASTRASLGRFIIESLSCLQFDGEIYPVNPKYEEVEGHRCYASLADLPRPPDVVACCINPVAVVQDFEALARCGAGAAVIYDGGFAEQDDEGKRRQAHITAVARDAGIALCGPNCMGVLSPVARSSTFLQLVRDASRLAGNVGLVAQSGSVAGSMLADLRRFGFSVAISSGNEAIVNCAAYIDYLVDDPATKVIAAFIETVREPDEFLAALDRADRADKPVVILKAGKSERAQRAIQSHTGGLAGASRVFSEALRAHRAIEVADLAEMTEVIALCQGKHWPRGPRVNVVTTSGGLVEMILDAAATLKVDLPALPAAVRNEVEERLGHLTGDGNPLDAWGSDSGAYVPDALALLAQGDATDSIVFCSGDTVDDQPLGRPGRELGYAKILAAAAKQNAKPYFLLTTRQNVMHRGQVEVLGEAGVPVLCGIAPALMALDKIGKWSGGRAASLAARAVATARPAGARTTINEFDSKSLLARYGLPVARELLVADIGAARAAAGQIGYPIALKAVSDDIPHKSDHGLVALGVSSDAQLAEAFTAMERSIATLGRPIQGYLIQELVAGGVEAFAGVSRDPQFGLTIAFGLGGVAIEAIRDFALRCLPLREGDAEAMIEELRASALFGAFRGRPAADKGALARCLYDLADFAYANRAWVEEIDLNPIKVREAGRGCVVVDALIVANKQ